LQNYKIFLTFANYLGFFYKKMNNFIKRTLSAIVYAGTVLATILANNSIYFGIVFILLTALAIHEHHKLLRASIKSTAYAMSAGVLLFASSYFYFTGESISRWLLLLYMLVLIFGVIHELFVEQENAIRSWGNLCSSQIMIALPFAMMNGIMQESKWLMLSLFILIWINDSGAYIVGSLMSKRKGGNHKMFPRVSPAKSWEGLIGGFIFDLAAGYVFYRLGWTVGICLTANPLLDSLIFALTIGIFGTLGDLIESLFKRTIGVKDSGRFLPGHGGVLDRFDSLLLAVPVAYLIFVYL
jgi:phosphatidate cytidylyltransferase